MRLIRLRARIHDLNRRYRVFTKTMLGGRGVTVVPQNFAVSVLRVNDLETVQDAADSATPVVTKDTITDAQAGFAADPFLWKVGDEWFLFYEIWNTVAHKGEIAFSRSRDLENWSYGGRCLIEPFHLSYPHVFEHDGEIYMMPEVAQTGVTLLYRAVSFPKRWVVDRIMIDEPVLDGGLFSYQGRWWCLAMGYWKNVAQLLDLRVFHSDSPTGFWSRHPASPVMVGNPRGSRPAGRTVELDGRLFRFAQCIIPAYGSAVNAFEITKLEPGDYAETPVGEEPILKGSGYGWNADGMHHIGVHRQEDGSLVVAVDGWHWNPRESV